MFYFGESRHFNSKPLHFTFQIVRKKPFKSVVPAFVWDAISYSFVKLYAFTALLCFFLADDTVVAIPYGSRHIRLVLKGPDHLCK
jgi:hypothetical protein